MGSCLVWNGDIHSYIIIINLLRNASPTKVRDTDNSLPSLCLCISIILKIQNPHVNVVQGIISLLLKSGHAGKQVYEVYKPLMHGVNKLYSHSSQFLKVFRRLRNVSVCLSYEATLKMMSVISEDLTRKFLVGKRCLWREWQFLISHKYIYHLFCIILN